jgi:hypothetical protein
MLTCGRHSASTPFEIGQEIMIPGRERRKRRLSITSITLTNVHVSAEKGITFTNSTVTAHGFVIKAASGQPLFLLQRAQVKQK